MADTKSFSDLTTEEQQHFLKVYEGGNPEAFNALAEERGLNPHEALESVSALHTPAAEAGEGFKEKFEEWQKEREEKKTEKLHQAHEREMWLKEQERIQRQKIRRINYDKLEQATLKGAKAKPGEDTTLAANKDYQEHMKQLQGRIDNHIPPEQQREKWLTGEYQRVRDREKQALQQQWFQQDPSRVDQYNFEDVPERTTQPTSNPAPQPVRHQPAITRAPQGRTNSMPTIHRNVGNRLRGLGGGAGKAARRAISGAGKKALRKGLELLAQGAAKAVIMNPVTLTVLGLLVLFIIILLLFIIIMILLVTSIDNSYTPPPTAAIPGLTIVLIGPTSVNNGKEIDYEVDVACTTECQQQGSIIIFEESLPTGTTFKSADGVYSSSPYPITWRLNDNTPTTDASGTNNYVFHFALNTTSPSFDTNVANTIYGDLEYQQQYQSVPGLSLRKLGPSQVANGSNITYEITAVYTGSDTVTLTDQIPANTSFVSATGKYTNTNGTISWVLKDNGTGPYDFTLVLKPLQNDVAITNTVYGTIPDSASGSGTNIVWLDSYSPTQFDPHFDAWVWTQCSQASMAEIFNSYIPGPPKYRIVDLETWALANGIWDPVAGLLFTPTARASIQKEADHYGFKIASYNEYPVNDTSLDAIIATARQGHPVMISAPGHWLVLWGADPDGSAVWLLDSSRHDVTWAPNHQVVKMPRNFFLHGGTMYYSGGHRSYSIGTSYWYDDANPGYGIAVVLTPK